jgi:hypothetical protein
LESLGLRQSVRAGIEMQMLVDLLHGYAAAFPQHDRDAPDFVRDRARYRRQEASMMFPTRLLPLLAVLVAPLCSAAQAADYEVGTSLVCDTQTQVERFVALFSGDAQAAIDAVNAEQHDPTACPLVNVAYLRGSNIGVARNGDNAFEIVRILVVGIDTAAGVQAVQPAAYFSLFGLKEYSV